MRLWRRLVASGVLVWWLASLQGATQAGAADAPANPPPALTISITSVTPAVLATGATAPVVVAGTVTALRPVTGLVIRLRYRDRPLDSRRVVADVAAGRSLRVGTTTVTEDDLAASLGPGDSLPFRLTLPADLATARDVGVHLLTVQVLGYDGPAFAQLALLRTFLSTATPEVTPAHVAWLWPLIDAPHRTPEGVFVDDGLARSFGRQGRLGRLLSEAASVPGVTLAIDPMLVRDADLMAGGYQVRNGSTTTPGSGKEAAAAWLTQLRDVVRRVPVVLLPYGDPDAVALQRAGTAEQIAAATTFGTALWAQVMPDAPPPRTDVVWPAREALDDATAATYARLGRTVIMRTSALGTALASPENPKTAENSGETTVTGSFPGPPASARITTTTTSGRLQVALVDDVVATSATGDRGATPANATRAVQRTLAELTQITADARTTPGGAATVLITPPRLWDPAPTYLHALREAMSAADWLLPASLPDVVGAPATQSDLVPRYPATARKAEVPPSTLRAVANWDGDTRRFAGALTAPEALLAATDEARLSMQSQSLARLGAQATKLLAAATAATALQQRQVHLIATNLTLSSSQDVSVSVVNGLSQDVRVRVGFDTHTTRLVMRGTSVQTVRAHKTAAFSVRAKVLADGHVVVDARLLSPTNKALSGDTTRLTVTIRRVGAAATVVLVAAALVLFTAAGVRTLRRVRGPRRRGGTGGPGVPEASA